MKNFLRFFVVFVAATSLSSCGSLKMFSSKKVELPLDYIDSSAKLNIRDFFNGEIEAFGIKQDESGKIINTMNIKINGKWDDTKGVIKQSFSYDDGTKDSRIWLITLDSNGNFEAVGHDVTNAAKGRQIGNAAQSNYSLMLSGKNGKEEFSFEDKMYLIDDKSMIIISTFKKQGLKINAADKTNSGKTIISLKKIGN